MANTTEIELHMKGMPDGYTVPDDDGNMAVAYFFAGLIGFLYLAGVSTVTAICYSELRTTYPAVRNDGCLIALLPLVSFVVGVLFPVEVLVYTIYLFISYVGRKTSAREFSCCGLSLASYRARRAARRAKRYEEQRRQQQQQQRTQQPDQAEPIATPPPGYTAGAFPSDMEAGQAW